MGLIDGETVIVQTKASTYIIRTTVKVLLLACLILASVPISTGGSAHLFTDLRCTFSQVHREVTEPLLAQYSVQIEAQKLYLSSDSGLEHLVNKEAYKEVATTVPVVFIKYERSEHNLGYIAVQYPQAKIPRFDAEKSIALNYCFHIQANVPEAKLLTVPCLML